MNEEDLKFLELTGAVKYEPTNISDDDFLKSTGAVPYSMVDNKPVQSNVVTTTKQPSKPTVKPTTTKKPAPQMFDKSGLYSNKPLPKKETTKSPLGNGPTEMRTAKKKNWFEDTRDKYFNSNNDGLTNLTNYARDYLNAPKIINKNFNFGDKIFGTQEQQEALANKKAFQTIGSNAPKYVNLDSNKKIEEDLKSGKIDVDTAKYRAQKVDNFNKAVADEEYRNVRNANVAYGTSVLASTPVSFTGAVANSARAVAPTVIKETIKNLATKEGLAKNAINLAKHVGTGGIEGGAFGGLDYGLKKTFGIEPEANFGESVAGGAGAGMLFGGGFGLAPAVPKLANKVVNSNALTRNIAEAISNNQQVQNVVAGISRALNTDITKLPELGRKTRELDESLVSLYDSPDRYLSRDAVDAITKAKEANFTLGEAQTLEEALRRGIGVDESVINNARAMNDLVAPTKAEPTITPPNEDIINSVKAMNESVAPKKRPDMSESSTKPVEEQLDINTPKEDLTHVPEAPSGVIVKPKKVRNRKSKQKQPKEEVKDHIEDNLEKVDEQPKEEITENWEDYKEEPKLDEVSQDEASAYDSQDIWIKPEETNLNDLGYREELNTTKYKSADPRLTNFVDNFFKSNPRKKKGLLVNKFQNSTAEEALDLYQNLITESERLTNQGKARKAGEVDLRSSKEEARDLRIIQNAYNKYAKKDIDTLKLPEEHKGMVSEVLRDAFATPGWKASRNTSAKNIISSRLNSDWEHAQDIYDNAFEKIANSKTTDRVKRNALKEVNNIVKTINADKRRAGLEIQTKKLTMRTEKEAKALSKLQESNTEFSKTNDVVDMAKANSRGHRVLNYLKYKNSEIAKETKGEYYSNVLTTAERKANELDDKIAKLKEEYNETKLSKKKESILIQIENLKKEKAKIATRTEKMVEKQFTDTSKKERTKFNENFGKKSQGFGKLHEQKFEGTGMSWDPHSEGIDQPRLKAEQAKWDKHKLDKDIEATSQMIDEDGLLDVPKIKAYIDDLRDTKKHTKVFKNFKQEYMRKNGISSQKFTKEFGTLKEYLAKFEKRADKIESRYATPLGVKPKQTLDYKDINSISSAIDDVTNTRFAKADRSFTSHKISDYIDEIAKEDKEVQKLIKDNFSKDDLFDFADDFAEGSYGRVDVNSNNITINSKAPLSRQLESIKHETHHILAERIAKACGKDSVEYRMFMEGVEANKRMHTFERKNPEAVKDWGEYQRRSRKDFDYGEDYLDSLDTDRYEEVLKYDELYNEYKNCDLEVSARKAGKGEWKFFGKDAKDYERILRIHRRRTSEIRKGNNAKAKGDAKRGSWQVSKRASRGGEDDVRSHSDVQRTDDGYNTERTILDSRNWEEYKSIRDGLRALKAGLTSRSRKLKAVYRQIEASSKATEQLKIDLGIITPEQSEKRLKMQHSDGKGVYFRKIPKGEEGIDLLRNYNEGKDSKVGIFGRKKTHNVDTASPEDILLNAKREEVKVEHIANALDVLEKNFATPIVDGRILKDYVPVNKKLLATTMYSGNTRQWYEAVSGGKNSILNAFEKEWSKLDEATAKEQREFLEALYDRTKDYDFQIPKAVYDKLFSGRGESVRQAFNRYGINASTVGKLAGSLIDYENAGFKRRVLVTGSFFVNNRIGNQLMILAKSDNLGDYVKALAKAKSIKDSDVPSEILEASILEAFKGYDTRRAYTGYEGVDNFLNLMHGHTIKTNNLPTGTKALATFGNTTIGLPNKWYNGVAKKCMSFNEKFERLERKQLFAREVDKVKKQLIKQTGRKAIATEEAIKYINEDPVTRELVIKNIEDILGDYNKFSRTERNVFKRVFPFYSWMRTISRHVYTGIKKHPERYSLIALEMHKLKEDDDRPIKEYQRGKFIKLPGVKDDKDRQIGILKPQANPFGTFEEQADNPLGSLAPGISNTIEAIRGKKLFADMHLTDKRYHKQFDRTFDTKEGKWIESGNAPLSVRAKYFAKQKALNTFVPYADNQLLKLPETIGGVKKLLKGEKFKTYDKTYDTSLFEGFNNGDRIEYGPEGAIVLKNKKGEEITRYAGNDLPEWAKLLNRFGAGLTYEKPLNQKEIAEYKQEQIRKQELKDKKKRLNNRAKGK